MIVYNLMVCDLLSVTYSVNFETLFFFGTYGWSSPYINKEIKHAKNIEHFCLLLLLVYLFYMVKGMQKWQYTSA